MMQPRQRFASASGSKITLVMRGPICEFTRGARECAVSEPLQRRTIDLTASLRSFTKSCAVMRLNWRFAAAAVRASHANALHARSEKS
eukprot:6537377-Lingulodinium_polyedra.AAC.1